MVSNDVAKLSATRPSAAKLSADHSNNAQPSIVRPLVAIDGNEANVANRVGSNVYAYSLLNSLYTWWQQHGDFDVRVYLSAPALRDMPPATQGWEYVVIPHVPLWIVWRLSLALRAARQEIALFFSPGHYAPVWCPVPLVTSVMDLAYEHFPHQFRARDYWQLRLLTRRSVQQAQHVVTISQFSQADLQSTYQVPAEKISVIYPGVDPIARPDDETIKKVCQEFGITKPFILYVGTLQPRKNLRRLIAAFSQLRAQDYDLQLVIAGKIGWQSEPILESVRRSPFAHDIRLVGFVTDNQKTALIAGAQVLTLLGLYEGFGIPPLEAIQMGTVPVVANTSSLPEVVGPDGLMVDPTNTDRIATGLAQALNLSVSERRVHLEALQRHAQQFSWNKSGEQLGKLLRAQLQLTAKYD